MLWQLEPEAGGSVLSFGHFPLFRTDHVNMSSLRVLIPYSDVFASAMQHSMHDAAQRHNFNMYYWDCLAVLIDVAIA